MSNSARNSVASILLAGSVLSGCAEPSVTYHNVNNASNPRDDRWILFQLTDSAIAIGTTATKPTQVGAGGVASASKSEIDLGTKTVQCVEIEGQTAPVCGDKDTAIAALVAPITYDDAVYAMAPHDSAFSTTKIAPSYVPDTLRFKSLSIDTEDHRKEVIETVGTVAVSLAKLAAVGAVAASAAPDARVVKDTTESLNLPTVIELSDAKTATSTSPKGLPNNDSTDTAKRWRYYLEFLDTPQKNGYYKLADLNGGTTITRAAVTSVCRPARLVLLSPRNKELQFGVTVADPQHLMSLPIPAKGKIEFSDFCGGNVTIEQETKTSNKDLADALFKQVDDLRQVLKPKKEDEGKTK